MWMMTSASAEEALKRYVMSSSPAPCIMNYGRKHGEERERGISRILGSIGSTSSRIKSSKIHEEHWASWAIRSHSTDTVITGHALGII
jgi:hypothetical protein